MSVGGGQGKVEEATASDLDPLRLTSRGLAALYAGRPLAAIEVAGLGSGGDPAVAELVDSVFATSTAYLTDYF